MRHIVIVGSSKTGTTGLFYSVVRGLESTGEPVYSLYEQHSARIYESLDKYAPERLVVAKLLVTNKEFDREVAAPFSHRILIVRDPRDTLVSALLFFPVLAINAGTGDDRIADFTELIRRKEKDPQSISMKRLLRRGYALFSSEPKTRSTFSSRFRKTIRYDDRVDSFVVTYEAFVDGELGDLEDFLSLKLGSRESARSRSHIARSGRYGGWRNWFTPDDIPYFRPLLEGYMRRYGYPDDWELADQPLIDSETASVYVERSCRSRREQRTLINELPESTSAQISLLRARADTGNTKFTLRLGRLLLREGGDESAQEAANRLTFAACTGNPKAMHLLANCYRGGVGLDQDKDRAKYWTRERRALVGRPPRAKKPLVRRVASRVKRELKRALRPIRARVRGAPRR